MNPILPSGKFVDYYDLLKIQADADLGQLRTGYLRMAKAHHPDAGGSTEQMQQLNMAYRVLANPTARMTYDKLYNLHTGKTTGLHLKDDYVHKSSSDEEMSDDYIDFFLDSVLAEFSDKPKPKKNIKKKIKKIIPIFKAK